MFTLRELGYASEEVLVARAVEDEVSHEVLRLLALRLAIRVGDRYVKRSGRPATLLAAAAMADFELALNAYRARMSQRGQVGYKFSTYFAYRISRTLKGYIKQTPLASSIS